MLPWLTIVPFAAINSGLNCLTISMTEKTLMSNNAFIGSSSVSIAGPSSPMLN